MGFAKIPNIPVFVPLNQVCRVRSRILSARQGKKELSDYFQELRTLIAAMQLDPLPEIVLVSIFMESLLRSWLERKWSGYTLPPLGRLYISR